MLTGPFLSNTLRKLKYLGDSSLKKLIIDFEALITEARKHPLGLDYRTSEEAALMEPPQASHQFDRK